MAAEFLDALITQYEDGRSWIVQSEFDYQLGTKNGEYVRVPAGFVTDFASIPRAFWNILPPTGGYGKAAVVHDWLYQRRRVSCEDPGHIVTAVRYVDRGEADSILNEAMNVLGVGRFTRWIIYSGVRVGGWVTWDRYRDAEVKGIPVKYGSPNP